MSRRSWGRYSLRGAILAEFEARQRKSERLQREMARRAKEAEYQQKLNQGVRAALDRLSAWDKIKQKLIADDLLRFADTQGIELRVAALRSSLKDCRHLKELASLKSLIRRLEQDFNGLAGGAGLVKQMEQKQQATLEAQRLWQSYSELRDLAELELDEAEADLKAVQQDKIVTGWCSGQLAEIARQIEKHNRLFQDESIGQDNLNEYFQEIQQAAVEIKTLTAGIDRLIEAAYEKEKEETKRAYVLQGMVEVLKGMGFVINKGPDLLKEDDPSSTVIVAANLPSGKRVELKVNQNGAVYSDFNGYSSDECLQDMAVFKQTLHDKFAVDYEARGELPNNPDQIQQSAKETPAPALSSKKNESILKRVKWI